MEVTGLCLLVIFDAANTLLHAVGFYSLFFTVRRIERVVQRMFFVNLSASQLLKNIIFLLHDLVNIISCLRSGGSENSFNPQFISTTVLYYLYLFSMFFIVCDVLSYSILNRAYLVTWDTGKTKNLLASVWILITCSAVVSSIYAVYDESGFLKFQHALLYTTAVCDVAFLTLTIAAYVVIIMKCRDKRVRGCTDSNRIIRQTFGLSVLLVMVFSTLTAIPSLIFSISSIIDSDMTAGFVLQLSLSTMISDTVSGIIFVCAYTQLRKLLPKKVCALLSSCREGVRERRAYHAPVQSAVELSHTAEPVDPLSVQATQQANL